MEAVQAGTEARLAQQQSTHEQALADCRTAVKNQVKEQLSSLTAEHEASMQALRKQHSSAFETVQAQMESERQIYMAEHQQLEELKQQLAGLQVTLLTQQSNGGEVPTLTFLDLRLHSAILGLD